jgi:site-specific recombinase XerD
MSSTGAKWAKGLAATKKGWTSEVRLQAPISGLYTDFMARCDREGLTLPSKGMYVEKLSKLLAFQTARGHEFWQQVTENDAEAWIEHIQTRDLSDHTKQGWLRVTKTFWRWVATRGLADYTPLLPRLKKLQGKQYLPSPQMLNAFLNKFDQETVWGFRDYVISMTILSSGARSGEICVMAPEDILWDQGMVRLFGKGRKERFVPVDQDQLFPLLKRWLQVRLVYVKGNGSDRLFISRAGGKCSPNMLGQAFAAQRERTGIGMEGHGSLSPHTLRHYFCTMYLVGGGDLFVLQEIAGHKDIETTMNYLHHAKQIGTVRADHAKVAPLKTLLDAGEGTAGAPRRKRRMN